MYVCIIMQEMFGEVNFTSSNVLPKAMPDMSEGNISAFSSLLHGRIQWKLAASFPKVPSYSEPQEFPGLLRQYQLRSNVPTHPQDAPPIFTRVLYIYFLHYS